MPLSIGDVCADAELKARAWEEKALAAEEDMWRGAWRPIGINDTIKTLRVQQKKGSQATTAPTKNTPVAAPVHALDRKVLLYSL